MNTFKIQHMCSFYQQLQIPFSFLVLDKIPAFLESVGPTHLQEGGLIPHCSAWNTGLLVVTNVQH